MSLRHRQMDRMVFDDLRHLLFGHEVPLEGTACLSLLTVTFSDLGFFRGSELIDLTVRFYMSYVFWFINSFFSQVSFEARQR